MPQSILSVQKKMQWTFFFFLNFPGLSSWREENPTSLPPWPEWSRPRRASWPCRPDSWAEGRGLQEGGRIRRHRGFRSPTHREALNSRVSLFYSAKMGAFLLALSMAPRMHLLRPVNNRDSNVVQVKRWDITRTGRAAFWTKAIPNAFPLLFKEEHKERCFLLFGVEEKNKKEKHTRAMHCGCFYLPRMTCWWSPLRDLHSTCSCAPAPCNSPWWLPSATHTHTHTLWSLDPECPILRDSLASLTRLMDTVFSHMSSFRMPALLNRMSIPPKASAAFRKAAGEREERQISVLITAPWLVCRSIRKPLWGAMNLVRRRIICCNPLLKEDFLSFSDFPLHI